MRVIRFDRKTGDLKVQVETLDDLWHLSRLIARGDMVQGQTYRREERRTEDEKRGEKKKVTLMLAIEKVEFQPFSERLRVSGRIVEGVESAGKFHTLNIEPGSVITITKNEWKPSHIRRLDDARTEMITAPLFISLDDDEATVARAHEYGIEVLAEIHSRRCGKSLVDGSDYRPGYFEEIWKLLNTLCKSGGDIVILGPGFEKEALSAYLAKKGIRTHVEYASQGGLPGINEVLRRGAGNKIIQDLRVARETSLIEKVFERIARGAPVAYGWDEVMMCLESGAVETLILHEDMLYEDRVEQMLQGAEQTHVNIQIISAHHNAGKRLANIGGVAALLRFAPHQ